MTKNFFENGGSGRGSEDGSDKPTKDHKLIEEDPKTQESPSNSSESTSKSSSSLLKVSKSSSLQSSQKSGNTVDRDVNPTVAALLPPSKKKVRVDVSARSLERNFMTVDRAMSEFLLLPEDLEGLARTTRRSPYKDGPEITVFRRSDVVERAHIVWGSRGKMIAEQDQRRQEIIQRRLPRDHRRLADEMRERYGLFSSAGLVVLGAVMANVSNLILKFVAWWFTRSLAMFAEFLHSVGDTANQVIVAVCMHLSYKKPTIDHPYGYTNLKFVSAVIAGTLILSVGAGVSVYQGVEGLLHPNIPTHVIWAIVVLIFAGMTEMISLVIAARDIKRKAHKRNMSFLQYVRYTQEPTVNVVLFEDCVAVLSVLITLTCLGMCWAMDTHIPDCAGAIIEGILLAVISIILIRTNATFLIGKSIPLQKLEKINTELEADVMVRAIHDVKGVGLGNFNVRYKAELDFDGRELTRAYLDRIDMNQLFNQKQPKGLSINYFTQFRAEREPYLAIFGQFALLLRDEAGVRHPGATRKTSENYQGFVFILPPQGYILKEYSPASVHSNNKIPVLNSAIPVLGMNKIKQSIKEISNVDELEDFMLRHGEALVDMLGGEIDRIEQKLKAMRGILQSRTKPPDLASSDRGDTLRLRRSPQSLLARSGGFVRLWMMPRTA